jgi:hypothetical protein
MAGPSNPVARVWYESLYLLVFPGLLIVVKVRPPGLFSGEGKAVHGDVLEIQ